MERLSRRAYLASVAAVAAGLAGCTAGGEGAGDGSTDRSTVPGTPTSGAPGGEESEGLRLESLAVGGSPGGDLTLDPQGRPLLLDFFATWCAPCKPQMESLRAIDASFPHLRMRSVTRETDREAVADFWRDYEGTWPVAMDPRLHAFEKYGVTRVPVLVVLDAAGSEVWRHAGLASEDAIERAVEEASA